MKTLTAGNDGRRRAVLAIAAVVAAGVFVVIKASHAGKIAFHLDNLEQSGILYSVPALAVAGLMVLLEYPRACLYALAFLLPFTLVGGAWGDSPLISVGKIAINVTFVGALFSTLLAPAQNREWITKTRLGHALLAWLLMIVIAIVIGFLNTPNRADWMRESNWMTFYALAMAAGTLLRDRRDFDRLLRAGGVGVAVMIVIAFWMLATGHRYDRPDVEGGEAFFRSPFSTLSIFYLYLMLATFFFGTDRNALTRRQQALVVGAIAALSAGLLSTMGRGLWVSFVIGGLVLVMLTPWTRATFRAGAVVAAGMAAAIGLVVLFDSLSPESRGNWTRLAWDFFLALGQKGSVTTLSRQLEVTHAIDVWQTSPFVGAGFGYPFPDIPYNITPADPFYMHNSFMNVLAKSGLLGLCALVWLLAVAVWRLFLTHVDRRAYLYDSVLTAATAAGVVQMATLGLFSPAMTTTDSVLSAALLIGMASAQHRVMLRRGPE
jgi:hypothetical protein